MRRTYKNMVDSRVKEYGPKFSDSELKQEFIRWFECGARIEVEFEYQGTKRHARGTIGVTTGWRPVFLLMPRVDSVRSSETLTGDVKFIKVIKYN